jgi:hypothetical protein
MAMSMDRSVSYIFFSFYIQLVLFSLTSVILIDAKNIEKIYICADVKKKDR